MSLKPLNRLRSALGFQKKKDPASDFRGLDPLVEETIRRVEPYTMTSWLKLLGLVQATEYVARHSVPGAFVECGVWKGGGMMAVALTLLRMGVRDRDLYLFDTFEGLPKPGEEDVTHKGQVASETWESLRDGEYSDWCRAGIEEVRSALATTGYPAERIHYVPGMVEDTVPEKAPADIAVLRLDTDFYASTRHELVHLFPRLHVGGVLILDDYGYWQGARRAVDEYLEEHKTPLLLHLLDHDGRMAIKQR